VENAKALAQGLTDRGFTLVSGGTDNHLMLVNLVPMELTGKEIEHLLDRVGITCNKNAIPRDPQKPFVTSGIRLGTPAVTTRGMKAADMDEIADLIAATVKSRGDEAALDAVAARVKSLTSRFPLFAE
jgi:glycine hydroxymethyltransferase